MLSDTGAEMCLKLENLDQPITKGKEKRGGTLACAESMDIWSDS